MNSNRENEKGNVESNVKYLRKNLLVPAAHFDDFDAYNVELLRRCSKDIERNHYVKK